MWINSKWKSCLSIFFILFDARDNGKYTYNSEFTLHLRVAAFSSQFCPPPVPTPPTWPHPIYHHLQPTLIENFFYTALISAGLRLARIGILSYVGKIGETSCSDIQIVQRKPLFKEEKNWEKKSQNGDYPGPPAPPLRVVLLKVSVLKSEFAQCFELSNCPFHN